MSLQITREQLEAEHAASIASMAAYFKTITPDQAPAPQSPRLQTPFDGALEMQRRGARLIPLRPRTKIAFQNDWQDTATNDLATIHGQNQKYPDANWACVAKAEPGGLWFFEVDDKCTLDQIKNDTGHDLMKEVLTFRTRSSPGKGHLYFQNAASIQLGNAQGKTADGKETWSARVDNRYVVAPLSWHPTSGKQYEIIYDAPITEAPAWLISWCAAQTEKKTGDKELDDESLVYEGGRNSALASVLGRARQLLGMDKGQLFEYGKSVNQKRCHPPLADTEVKTIAYSIGRYEIKPSGEGTVLIGGVPVGQVQSQVARAADDLSWLELSEATARPVFPEWIMKGTSLHEGLAKPVSVVNSRFPELIWMPAVQLFLNHLHSKVSIRGMRLNVNMFLGIISSPGKFFKSSSCRLAHEYFGHMGLAANLTPVLRNSEGKTVIGQAGSSEGFGLQLQAANAKHGILFNDELGKLVSKAGIENSSLPHDLLSWYESNEFSNPIKSRNQSFAFPAGTYCFGWQFCTTIRGFNGQWSRLAGIASGMPDRTFFLITPENPKPLSGEVFVNTVEKAIETRKLIDRAVERKEYQVCDYAQDSLLQKSAAFGDPRSMNMVYKFALYFAIDLGLDEIDEDCISRALALVEYRQKAVAFLQPIEAKNDEGRLLKEILRELRQHGGKMTRREFSQAMHPEEYGSRVWTTVYKGAVAGDYIREFTEPGARGQIKKMVGLVKGDVRLGPE